MNQPHKTAIARSKPSAPIRALNALGVLRGKTLDYGCGRGVDAEAFGMDKYDPHFFPGKPKGKYDTITCSYVLNVITECEAAQVLTKIRGLLKKDGIAYITVRRDIKEDYTTKAGTYQRLVDLDLPVVQEKKGQYITYRLETI